MQFHLKAVSKNKKNAIYSGAYSLIKIPVKSFIGAQPPKELNLEGPFAPPRVKKSEMTPEERKAAKAARPKLTKAEQIARLQARLAKLQTEATESDETESSSHETQHETVSQASL